MTITQPITPSKSGSRRANALPSACMLDEYRIDSILGAGGFGVTYKALDTHLETWVAIKEYFPVEWSFRDADGVTVHPNTQGETSASEGQISDYLWGLERFLDEARALARIQHPYVVRVKRYFRAHGTAYIVMDYEEGEPLSAVLRDGETLGEDEVRGLLEDVLPALQAVHEQGYLHRDIKPSNLYVRSSDHRVILIDFGAAREAVGRHSKSVTSLVTPGYSPPEQYTTRTDRYGTWTDIYALGAVLYRCITGRVPTEAAERLLDDHLEPAIKVGVGRYSTNLLEVIDRALAVRPEQRFLTVADMQSALVGPQGQDSDQTVILTPLAKPANLAQPLGTSRITRRPERSTEEPTEDDQHDGLNVTPAPTTADSHQARQQQSLPPGGTSSRWRLPALLAGGVTLMAVAAVIVWLGSSEPALEREPAVEQKPPPRYSLNHGESAPTPVEAPVAATALPTVVAPGSIPSGMTPVTTPTPRDAGVESPAPVETEVTSPPIVERALESSDSGSPQEAADLEKPPVAGQDQESMDAGESPVPVRSESTLPLPASGLTGVPLPGVVPAVTTQPPANTAAEQITKPATDQKPQARDAKSPPKRPTRQRTVRKRKEQPILVTPAQPVQARPAPASPKRSNLWDAPTDSGFNQK